MADAPTYVSVKAAAGSATPATRLDAKYVVARACSSFHALLDFDGVESITPEFARELFHATPLELPSLKLDVINASPPVKKLITAAKAGK